MKRLLVFTFSLTGCLLLLGCRKAPPENVAATVNDRPITYEQLDKQYQFSGLVDSEHISPDERTNRRMEVLRSLVDHEIMLQRAEKLGLMAVDSDVDAAVAEMRAPYTQEEFQRELEQRNMTEEDLRAQIRRDLSVQKLLNREITAHISITDQEVTDFYESNKTEFNFPEPQLHLAQILVTPGADLNVTNLRRDAAQSEEEAEAKIKSIKARLDRGEDFAMVARNYSEDPNTAPNGGDLGFINESSLNQASVELRGAVVRLQPGQLSEIIQSPDGYYRIFRLISREPAGQRQLDDPRVQQTIRDQLRNRKDQLLKNAYYEVARNEAEVVNYYALQITESKGPVNR